MIRKSVARFFNCFLKAYSVGSIEKILKLLIFLSIKFLAKLKDLSPIFEPISIILKILLVFVLFLTIKLTIDLTIFP